jgi:hypothetical protein
LREALSGLSDAQREAFLGTADRAAEERRAAEAAKPAEAFWNGRRSDDLLVLVFLGAFVSLGVWASFDPLVNGGEAVVFLLASFGALLLAAGLARACVTFLRGWRDLDEGIVLACVFVAVGASPWWPGLAGVLRNWLKADPLSEWRLWLSTALIVVVPTLLFCVVGVVTVEIVGRWRRRA